MELITGKHFARSNPDQLKEKILGIYAEKLREVKNRWPLFNPSSSV
jgi:hypothetical protein